MSRRPRLSSPKGPRGKAITRQKILRAAMEVFAQKGYPPLDRRPQRNTRRGALPPFRYLPPRLRRQSRRSERTGQSVAPKSPRQPPSYVARVHERGGVGPERSVKRSGGGTHREPAGKGKPDRK